MADGWRALLRPCDKGLLLRPRDLLPGSPFPTTAAWEASRSGYDYPVLPPYTAEDMQRPVERFSPNAPEYPY